MNKNKTWFVYYRPKEGGNETESGFETKIEAVDFLAESIAEGRSLHDIKFNGRSIPASQVFALLRDAKLMLVKQPDATQESVKPGR